MIRFLRLHGAGEGALQGPVFSCSKQTDAGKERARHRYHVRQPADIPKKHCCMGTAWRLVDMRAEKKAEHTLLNGEPLPQSLSVPLKHGDAKSVWRQTLCRFGLPDPGTGQTLDYNCADPLPGAACRNRPSPWSSTPRKSPCWSAARKLRCRRRNDYY